MADTARKVIEEAWAAVAAIVEELAIDLKEARRQRDASRVELGRYKDANDELLSELRGREAALELMRQKHTEYREALGVPPNEQMDGVERIRELRSHLAEIEKLRTEEIAALVKSQLRAERSEMALREISVMEAWGRARDRARQYFNEDERHG